MRPAKCASLWIQSSFPPGCSVGPGETKSANDGHEELALGNHETAVNPLMTGDSQRKYCI